MNSPSRGDVYWVDLPRREDDNDETRDKEYGKKRPGVIIQDDNESRDLDTTIVIPTSSGSSDEASRYLSWVFISATQECVPKDSIAMCSQIRVAAPDRIGDRLGELSKSKFREIERATELVLGFY